jgi:alkaline phosphatase D
MRAAAGGTLEEGALITRREFLQQSTLALAQAPGIIRAPGARPEVSHGVAAGALGATSAIVWSRCDRAARMVVEYATNERFADLRRVAGATALPASDFTARTVIQGLPRGERVFYRVVFEDLNDIRMASAPAVGSFLTAAADSATIIWSADTAGQGWGINEAWGGMRLYETMRREGADLFIHAGDTIYADGPVPAQITLDDGRIWRNVITEAKSRVAESLDDYRGNYKYNLIDQHLRRFNASLLQTAIWDDHEVRDNWYEGRDLRSDDRYREKAIAVLAARARTAFLEFNPVPASSSDTRPMYRYFSMGPLVDVFIPDLRSYRGPNSDGRQAVRSAQTRVLGDAQFAWLRNGVTASRAHWKVIVSSLPIGLVVRDGDAAFEAIANAENGAALGRELEIAELLRAFKQARTRGIVWITGDVHYCAAHHYDPARAKFTEFDPFWEFVAGPLNAGTFGPNALDLTFGPEVKFSGVPPGIKPNRSPMDGFQFYGKLQVDARSRAMTVSLHDLEGRAIFSVELPPVP